MHLLITLPRGNRLCGLLAETEIVGGKSFSLDKSSTKGKVRETKFLALIFFDHRGNNPNKKTRRIFPTSRYCSSLKSQGTKPRVRRAKQDAFEVNGYFHPPLRFFISPFPLLLFFPRSFATFNRSRSYRTGIRALSIKVTRQPRLH